MLETPEGFPGVGEGGFPHPELKVTGTEQGRTFSTAPSSAFGAISATLGKIKTLLPKISPQWAQAASSADHEKIRQEVESIGETLNEEALKTMKPEERARLLLEMKTTREAIAKFGISHEPLSTAIARIEQLFQPIVQAAGAEPHEETPSTGASQSDLRNTVIRNLVAAFDERISRAEEKMKELKASWEAKPPGEEKTLEQKDLSEATDTLDKLFAAKKPMVKYLGEHFEEMIAKARGRETAGGITASKSETRLPYSLRCFKGEKPEEFSFEISFGTFISGSEANIKDLVDLKTGKLRVKRDLREKTPDAQKNEEKIAARVKGLVDAGVPGIASIELEPYKGKMGEEKKRPVLERYEGGDLLDYLAMPQSDDEKALRLKHQKMATGLVRSIREIHRNGVVHLDLKFENVLLDKEGNPYLTDFSMSALEGEQIVLRGTPGYIDPAEMKKIASDPDGTSTVDPKHDLWALGMVLLHLMATTESVEFVEAMCAIVEMQENREDVTAKVNEVRARLQDIACPIGQPYGAIIAALLDPNPATRMSDEQLERQWPGYRS